MHVRLDFIFQSKFKHQVNYQKFKRPLFDLIKKKTFGTIFFSIFNVKVVIVPGKKCMQLTVCRVIKH